MQSIRIPSLFDCPSVALVARVPHFGLVGGEGCGLVEKRPRPYGRPCGRLEKAQAAHTPAHRGVNRPLPHRVHSLGCGIEGKIIYFVVVAFDDMTMTTVVKAQVHYDSKCVSEYNIASIGFGPNDGVHLISRILRAF